MLFFQIDFKTHLMFILCFWGRFEVGVVGSFINFTADDKSPLRRNGICQNIGKLPALNYRKDFRINTIQKRFPSKLYFNPYYYFFNLFIFSQQNICQSMVLVRGLSWIFKLYQKKTTCLNTNSNTVFPLWDRTKEDAFLAADELWEEIKSLIYSKSNDGSRLHEKETGTGGEERGLQC